MKNLLFVLSFLIPNLVYCCSCAWVTSFCETISQSSDVAVVEILKTYDASQFGYLADVEVVETLQGTAVKTNWTILVSGGTSCDPDYSLFQAGDSMIISLENKPATWIDEQNDFYFENGCSSVFLLIKNGNVGRRFFDPTTLQTLDEFKNDLSNCADLSVLDNPEILDLLSNVYPNPTEDLLNIKVRIAPEFNYEIINAAGQLLMKEKVLGEWTNISVRDLPKGAYFVKIWFREDFVIKRFVKI